MNGILSTKLVQNSLTAVIDEAFQQHWLRILFRLMALSLGGLHTWAAVTSHSMNADGIAYLDIGEAYLQGDWETAISPVWSPMYSWILGLVLYIVNPSMRWEFPVVHLVNFGIFLGTLVCFEFFWHQLRHYQQTQTPSGAGDGLVLLPEWAWIALGYTLFIWSSLTLIEIWAVTPDMLMAAFVYLTAGLIVRIRLGVTSWYTFILLGLVLGLGYLTKAVMLPLTLVFLGVSLLSVGNIRQAIPRVLVALFVFLLFSVPFIATVSEAKGELTFGDASTLTYVRHVNGVPYPHWQGNPPGSGIPEHPTRKILDTPAIYEFGAPISGTYPVVFNPSYWYEGVVVDFDLGKQLGSLISSALFYFDLFFRQQGILVVGVLIFYLMGRRWRMPVIDVVRQWGLVILAFVAFGLYAPVLVEGRYIGVFVVILWADLLANVRLPESQASRRLISLLSVVMILFMLMNILTFNVAGLLDINTRENQSQIASSRTRPPSWPGEVAEELHRLGIQPGDKVAIIGYAFDAYWARLARVQIVAEMLARETDAFWLGDPSTRSEVIQAFASTGAKAIVAESVPNYAPVSEWHQVGNSNYYIYLFTK